MIFMDKLQERYLGGFYNKNAAKEFIGMNIGQNCMRLTVFASLSIK